MAIYDRNIGVSHNDLCSTESTLELLFSLGLSLLRQTSLALVQVVLEVDSGHIWQG